MYLHSGSRDTPPRIVFFGPPNAGKTALLSAFLQVASADEAIRLTPAEATSRDVVSHADPAGCVLVDTDGKTAASLIADPGRFRPRPVRRESSSVTAAVYTADALVLLIDASAKDAELDQIFNDFGRFLEKLEETRTDEREVGGLPIFLTLTKCDTLWQRGDDSTEWLGRVQARQREVRTHFEHYLSDATDRPGPIGFGSVEVSVAATALRHPAAAGFENRGETPFGVEELYEDTTAAARSHHRRIATATRRLRWTLASATGLMIVLTTALGFLCLYPGAGTEGLLAARVRTFQDRVGPPAVKLSDRHFAKNQAELSAIREAAGFDRLPHDLQDYVVAGVREFAEYREYRNRFRLPQLGPTDLRSKGELDQLESALASELVPPPDYASQWAGTEAVRLWEKWKTDSRLLRSAEETLHEWYRGLVRRATGLQLVPTVDPSWRRDVERLFADAESPPFRATDPVPGSAKLPIRGGATLTYAPAFEFDRLAAARQDLASELARLRDLRGLTDALGMTSGPGTPPPVLELPDPTSNLNDSRTLAADRLRTLRQEYPSSSSDYREWFVGRFPDPLRSELRRRLDRAFEVGARHARRLIAQRLASTGATETHADWQPVAAWLESDPVMKDWGQFLGLIRRIAENQADSPEPVAELAVFLRRDRFDGALRVIEISIPDDLRGQRAIPTGPFVVTIKSSDGSSRDYRYRIEGDPRRDGPSTTSRFVPDGHDGSILIRPGDEVSAVVPVRANGLDFELVWSDGRSRVYTFDRLVRQPEVRRRDSPFAGERATGVRMVLLPEPGWPSLPALLP